MPMPTFPLARLGGFRAELHACFSRRADALFELGDALLCAQAVPVAAAPEPGAGPPARLGQRLCRPGPRPHRRRAAARPARQLPAARRPAGVRGGRDHLAALRRRVLTGARLLLPSLAPFGRPADHRRLGLPVDRPAQLRPRLLDRPGRRAPAAPLGRHRPDRRRQIRALLGTAARRRAGAAVCVRRRLRLGPAHPGPGRGTGPRCWCGCAPTAASTPTRRQRRARPRAAGRAATAPSSPSPTRPPGRPRPPPWPARTTSTAP